MLSKRMGNVSATLCRKTEGAHQKFLYGLRILLLCVVETGVSKCPFGNTKDVA